MHLIKKLHEWHPGLEMCLNQPPVEGDTELSLTLHSLKIQQPQPKSLQEMFLLKGGVMAFVLWIQAVGEGDGRQMHTQTIVSMAGLQSQAWTAL